MTTLAIIQLIKKSVFQVLNPQEYKVFIFGSRAQKKARKFSDIDVGIEGKSKIPAEKMTQIREVLENSDLPFFADIVDFKTVTQVFKNLAKKNIIPLN